MRHAAERDTRLLEEFAQRHGTPCPHDVDPFDWSVEALDDLARLVAAVGPAAETVSGCASTLIERRVQELVTAIVAHRNSLLSGDVRQVA